MPGFHHLGEQSGIDWLVHGPAESTDSRFGTYQLYDCGQVFFLPLSLLNGDVDYLPCRSWYVDLMRKVEIPYMVGWRQTGN